MKNRPARALFSALLLTILCIGLLAFSSLNVHAVPLTPSDAATELRKALFAAQTAVITQDVTALQKLDVAKTLYIETLATPINAVMPAANIEIERAFIAAAEAIRVNDDAAFAAQRALIWVSMLNGAAEATFKAISTNDVATARAWFNVREFRSSTRFNRPSADGTLALTALQEGKLSVQEALATVRNDLFDTYQARLNTALTDADNALLKNYGTKLAEAAGAAAGYFAILSPAFLAQRGAEISAQSTAQFEILTRAAIEADSTTFGSVRKQITEKLKGFRAAPLSQTELDRRAGQLMRYIGLVDVEYARGVRDGKVVKDLEIQEAHTFREAALAAFVDLEPTLEGLDPARTAKVNTLIYGLKTQIDAVVEPRLIEDSVTAIGDELTALIPPEWLKNATDSDFDVIFSVLDQIEPAVKQEQYQLAENARIEAYAILDSGIEKKLRGFAPDVALKVEAAFWAGEPGKPGLSILIASRAPANEIKSALGRLRTEMKDAQMIMASFKTAPGAVVGNAAVIVFREGLEAVLILASLIASLRTAETKKYRRPIALGAVFAFFASILTWVVANTILTALSRFGEKLEAIVGIIAIGVLLVITNWFFHKTYWTGWMANFHQQKNKLIGGGMAFGTFTALILLGFSSIYREGFETVLFLQSLVLEAGVGTVVQGVLIGLFFTLIVGIVTFALQAKLPYKRMLVITGIFIGVVLVSMVGKTVFALQAVGWLPISPISGVWFPYWLGQWFGLYATWQGIILQIASAVFVIGSYFLAEHQNKVKRAAIRGGRGGKPEAKLA